MSRDISSVREAFSSEFDINIVSAVEFIVGKFNHVRRYDKNHIPLKACSEKQGRMQPFAHHHIFLMIITMNISY